jgi:hypothetical protein
VVATNDDEDDTTAAAATTTTSTINENEIDDGNALAEEEDEEEETTATASASTNAAHLSRQQGTEIKRVDYHELMRYSKDLCEVVSNTPNSVGAAAVILQLTRLAHGGTIAEGTLHDIVSSTANAFGTKKKRKRLATHGDSATAIEAAPLTGRVPHAGRPTQHRKRAASEGPAPRQKKDPSCGFCGATMKTGDHSKVTSCSEIRQIGTLLRCDGTTGFSAKKTFAAGLLDGTSPCVEISSEERLNVLDSLPTRGANFLSVHQHFTVNQKLSKDYIFQASNRAAMVTMYGQAIGSTKPKKTM